MRISALAAFVAATTAAASIAQGAELTIGLPASTTSMDPQFYVYGPNSAMARNVFDGLANQDDRQQIQPALALAWKFIDDTTWEFKLRPDVHFHDGSGFTANDVVASIKRVALASRNSPSSFDAYVKDIAAVTAVDPLTVRIATRVPTPLLPNNLSRIAILPKALEKTPTQELNAGHGVIGTGPFRFVSWAPDDKVILDRSNDYWDGKAAWDKVTFRVLKGDGARVAAMLSGDVDMIEGIPPADTDNLRKSGRLSVVSVSSNRIMYLHMDQGRDVSPFAIGPDGRNPLQKAAVRKALSLAINRQALVDRIMDGQGLPAGQLVPDGYFGHSPNLGVDSYDPARAKRMLADAGYPDGFTMTFHASNDRYPNDSKVAQAIGQMFSRVGIKIDVVTLPGAVYFSRASAQEFSLIMGGAAVETGEASGVLGPLLETYGPNAGQGNRGRYSSPAFDTALREARSTLDDQKRQALLQTATEIAMKDEGVIPIFFIANAWATRKNLVYEGRTDGYTLPFYVRQVN